MAVPRLWQKAITHTATAAGQFVPFGTCCLILENTVRMVDSAEALPLLGSTVKQLFQEAAHVGRQGEEAAMLVMQHFICDHGMAAYTRVLRNAMDSLVPVLFMGGQVQDYESKVIQRQTPTGKPSPQP